MSTLTQDIVAFTFNNRRDAIADAILKETPLLDALSARAKVMIDGGSRIERSLEYLANDTWDAIADGGTVDTTIKKVHTSAAWDWRQYGGTVGITKLEQVRNRGDAAITNLLKARERNLINSSSQKLEEHIFGASASGSVRIEALQEGVADNPSSNPARGNYGGIDRSDQTWFRNKTQADLDSSLTVTSTFPFAERGPELMRLAYVKASKGPKTDRPNLFVTHQDVYTALEGTLAANLQFRMGDLSRGDFGFADLAYRGVPVIWSNNMSSDNDNTNGKRMYVLNTNYIEFVCSDLFNMSFGEFQEPVNELAISAKLLWFGNLIVTNPIRQCVIRGFTT